MKTRGRQGDSPFPGAGESAWKHWPVLYLVACKPSQRARWRWLRERLQVAAGDGADITGLLAVTDAAVVDLAERGILTVQRSGRQIIAVAITRNAMRRVIWRHLAGSATWGSTPQLSAVEIAEATGQAERTVWRWLSGEYVPRPQALARLWIRVWATAPEDVRADMRSKYGAESPLAGSFIANLMRQQKQMDSYLRRCEVSNAERRRALEWAHRQLEPVVELVHELLRRESPEAYKALFKAWQRVEKDGAE
jgi:hypothetical protein